jgi:hypothetical protein
MKTICIVPCGKTKIWDRFPDAGPTPAKNVYIGVFARKCQEYARVFYPGSYYILSAKYGFLHPDDIVPEKYNITFKNPTTLPISITKLVEIARKKGLLDTNGVVVVAGRDYSEIIRKVFVGKQIIEPLRGCKGNGFMMQKINDAIQNRKPIE